MTSRPTLALLFLMGFTGLTGVSSARLIDIFSYDEGEHVTRLAILHVPLIKILEIEWGSEEDSEDFEMTFIKIPLITGLHRKRDTEDRDWRVLDVPIITIFQREYDVDDKDLRTRFIKLPIVGSIYQRDRKEEEDRKQFLFFFRYSSARPSEGD